MSAAHDAGNHGRRGLRPAALAAWRAAENALDALVTPAANPLRHLGAIGFFAFWLLAASGIVLFALIDTSVAGAWRSIQALEEAPLALGRLLRGLHRYSADLLVLALVAHILREWVHGHESGVHRFAWLTGVPLAALVFALGIGGFWLNWDALGAFSASATAEWIDAIPWLGTSLTRNFLGTEAVSDRLFSLLIFVHLGLPLLMLFVLWFHIQRLTRATVWPPRRLALLTAGALAAAALAWPVLSHPAAALASVPEALRWDWMLLAIHPLTYATSPAWGWVLVVGTLVLLFALPFFPRRVVRAPAAVVDPAHCNGCQRCFVDCPYAAITMVPHPNQRIGRTLAVVDPDLCAACGICAGACPTSTPFRRAEKTLVTGIDMPERPIAALRERLRQGLAALKARDAGSVPLVLFACERGAQPGGVRAGGDVLRVDLLCAGQLPPSFIEYALRDGAGGVLVAACREGGCEFRHGESIAMQRLTGQREPHLRARAAQGDRVALVFAGAGDAQAIETTLERLRTAVARAPLVPEESPA